MATEGRSHTAPVSHPHTCTQPGSPLGAADGEAVLGKCTLQVGLLPCAMENGRLHPLLKSLPPVQ